MNQNELTARQQKLMAEVRRDAFRDGTPARDLLLLADVPREDRAAVAEVLAPGAGKDYL